MTSEQKETIPCDSVPPVSAKDGARVEHPDIHPDAKWDSLFHDLDRNHDGRLSQIELISRINYARKHNNRSFLERIRDVLGMPDHIVQEDGTRDVFEHIFQEMDQDQDKEITLAEFRTYVAKRFPEHHATGSAASANQTLDTTLNITIAATPKAPQLLNSAFGPASPGTSTKLDETLVDAKSTGRAPFNGLHTSSPRPTLSEDVVCFRCSIHRRDGSPLQPCDIRTQKVFLGEYCPCCAYSRGRFPSECESALWCSGGCEARGSDFS